MFRKETMYPKKDCFSVIFIETTCNMDGILGCLPFDREIRLGCRKHNGKRFTSLPQNCHIRYGLNPKKGAYLCSVSLEPRRNREILVNGKQHSVWFVPTRMKWLPQNVVFRFRLEFAKSGPNIYLPSRISKIFGKW